MNKQLYICQYHKKINAMIADKYNDPIEKYYRIVNRLWWVSISCFIICLVLFIVSFITPFEC